MLPFPIIWPGDEGYYSSWDLMGRDGMVNPKTIPYDKLTVINYAYASPQKDWSLAAKNPLADALLFTDAADPAIWENRSRFVDGRHGPSMDFPGRPVGRAQARPGSSCTREEYIGTFRFVHRHRISPWIPDGPNHAFDKIITRSVK